LDPANKDCPNPGRTGTHRAQPGQRCFTEEHFGDAPKGSYLDERTAGHAVRSLGELGRRAREQDAQKPWFMAVGFVRPHLPFVCPAQFWAATNDPGEPAQASSSSVSVRGGASLAGRMLGHQEAGDSGFGEVRKWWRTSQWIR
jgi:arylsulfatase A-like enzyme